MALGNGRSLPSAWFYERRRTLAGGGEGLRNLLRFASPGQAGKVALAAFFWGALGVVGTLAATEAQDTADASGSVIVAGTLAATEAQDTTSFSGNVAAPQNTITGTLAATDTADSLTAAGSVTRVTGTLAATEATDALSSSGNVIVAGTLAATDAQDSFASSGSVIVAGALAATDAQDSFAAAGEVRVVGTLAATDQQDTFASTGEVRVVGALAATEAQDTFAGSGGIAGLGVSGTLAVTDAQDSLSGAGFVARNGAFAATDAADAAAGAGTVVRVHGAIAAVEAQDLLAASGECKHTGTIAATEAQDALSAAGQRKEEGSLAAQEAADALQATGLAVKLIPGDLAASDEPDTVYFRLYHGKPIYGIEGAVRDVEAGEVAADAGVPDVGADVDDGATSVEVSPQAAVASVDAMLPRPWVEYQIIVCGHAEIGYYPLWPMFRDSVSVTDAARVALTKNLRQDGASVSDGIAISARERTFADDFAVGDSVEVMLAIYRQFADAVLAQDTVSLSSGFTVSLSADSTSASDALTRAFAKAFADGVWVLDSARPAPAKLPADSSSATDALSISIRFARSAADIATPADALATSVTKARADSAVPTDAVAKATAKPAADSVSTSDSVRRSVVNRPAEAVVPLDAMVYTMLYRRTLADTVVVADDFAHQNPGKIEKLDTLVVAELLAKSLTRPLADSRPATDAVSLTPRKATEDSVAQTDSGTIVFEGGYADDYFDADYTELSLINF